MGAVYGDRSVSYASPSGFSVAKYMRDSILYCFRWEGSV